jgi:hypothetical protein
MPVSTGRADFPSGPFPSGSRSLPVRVPFAAVIQALTFCVSDNLAAGPRDTIFCA